MMKSHYALFFLIFSLPVKANEYSSWLKTLEAVQNKQLNTLQCVEAVSFDSSLHNNCAQTLCGKPNEAKTSFLTDSNYDQYLDKVELDKFDELSPMINEILMGRTKKNERLIEAYKKNLIDSKIDFKEWDKFDYENFAGLLFDDFYTEEIDKSKPLGERLSFTITLPKDASQNFKDGIEAFVKEKKDTFLELPFSQKINIYTVAEAKEILIKELRKAKDLNAEEVKKEVEEINAIEDDFSGQFKIGQYALRIEELDKEKLKETTLCETEACRNSIKKHLSEVDHKKNIQAFEKKNKDISLVSNKISYCKSEFAMDLLGDFEKEKFLKVFPEIKENFVNKVSKGLNFSEHSKKVLQEYLDKSLNFVFSKPKAIKTFSDKIKTAHQQYSRNKEFEEESEFTDQKKLLEQALSGEFGQDPLQGIGLCRDKFSPAHWDQFASKDVMAFKKLQLDGRDYNIEGVDFEADNLFISQYSCTHYDHGKSILAHELGHALSHLFLKKLLSPESYENYIKMRECSTNLHKKKGESILNGKKHSGDSVYTEEDMADIISSIAEPDQSSLFTCALLSPSIDGKSYTNLEITNQDGFDSHSTPFLRLLWEAVHKDVDIPESCKQIMNQNSDQYRFNKCF